MSKMTFIHVEAEGSPEAVGDVLAGLFPETPATTGENGESGLITVICSSCDKEFDELFADPSLATAKVLCEECR